MKWFRKEALQAQKYTLAENGEKLRLHQNEAAFFSQEEEDWWQKTLARLVQDKSVFAYQYPSLVPHGLLEAYANSLGVQSNAIEVVCGSSQAFDLLALACFGVGRSVALPAPSFSLYSHLAKLYECNIVEIEANEEFEFTPQSLLSPNVLACHVVIVCSPNNPTGSLCSAELLKSLCLQAKGLVVIDEAYIEFSSQESFCKYAESVENVLVLRTLSKAHCGASLRIGAMVSHPKNIEIFRALRPPYSIPLFSEKLGEEILRNGLQFLPKRVFHIQTLCAKANAKLLELKEKKLCEVFSSKANFVFFRASNSAYWNEIFTLKFGLNVRYFGENPSQAKLSNCFRVSFGKANEVERFLEALIEIENSNLITNNPRKGVNK